MPIAERKLKVHLFKKNKNKKRRQKSHAVCLFLFFRFNMTLTIRSCGVCKELYVGEGEHCPSPSLRGTVEPFPPSSYLCHICGELEENGPHKCGGDSPCDSSASSSAPMVVNGPPSLLCGYCNRLFSDEGYVTRHQRSGKW